MKIIFLGLILFSYLLTTSCTKIDYFSDNYIRFLQRFPGNEFLFKDKQNRFIEKSKILMKEGFRLYQNQNNRAAIIKYEEALRYYPSGELYYNYGNSLANDHDYIQSIKAYRVAYSLSYPKTNIIYYNIACVYSLNNDTSNSYSNLLLAVINGYSNLYYLNEDQDLANLHKTPVWNYLYYKWSNIGFSSNDLEETPSDKVIGINGLDQGDFCTVATITLFNKGKVKKEENYYNNFNIFEGTWKTEDERIIINYVKKKHSNEKYGDFEETTIDENEELNWGDIITNHDKGETSTYSLRKL